MIAYPESLLWDLPRITAEYELLIEPYFPQYAFYENKGKRKCDYFCTRCHCWHCNEPFRLCHNEYFACRHCGEEVKAKALHFGRNSLERSRKFGLCFAVDGDFYIRFVTAHQRFSNNTYNENPAEMSPEYTFSNEYLYVYRQHAMQRFTYDPWKKRFKPMKSDGIIPSTPQGYGWYWGASEKAIFNGWDNTVLINFDCISNTNLRYSCAENFVDAYNTQTVLKWLNIYVRHNNAEYLIKGGFENIAKMLASGYMGLREIRWKENNLLKMLGCRKCDIGCFSEFSAAEIDLYRAVLKENPNIQNAGEFTVNLIKLGREAVKKVHSYGISFKQIMKYGKSRERVLLWRDYLSLCSRLPDGIQELMPPNLERAHDRANEQVKYYTDRHEAELIAERAEKLKPLIMNTDNLIMLAPRSGEEIISEGRILKHCVGGYVLRHAQGDTIILFIRHKDEPLTPYFTIEVDPKTLKIVQCHGYKNERESNKVKPPEIVEFEKQYNKFLEEIKSVRNNSKRTA